MRKTIVLSFALLISLLLFNQFIFAQGTASISGRVTYMSGSGVFRARIVAQDFNAGAPTSTYTDLYGYYSVDILIPPHDYYVTCIYNYKSTSLTFMDNPRYLFNVFDSVSDVNFVANQ